LFVTAAAADANPHDIVGKVLGKPVSRGDVSDVKGGLDASKAPDAFFSPLFNKIATENREKITPTEEEIQNVTKYLDSCDKAGEQKVLIGRDEQTAFHRMQLAQIGERLAQAGVPPEEAADLQRQKVEIQKFIDSPGRSQAVFMLVGWKLQKFLHDSYGGGRILFQQAGLEAFDATRAFLESEEKKGSVEFTDPVVRTAAFDYWTKDHGPFLSTDEKQLALFRNPDFLKPGAVCKK